MPGAGWRGLEAADEGALGNAAVAVLAHGYEGADDGADGDKGDEEHENEHGRAFRGKWGIVSHQASAR